MAFNPQSGTPGDTRENDSGKVQYQAIVSWHNSCGQCIQYDHAIMSHSWPFPYHFGCNCIQVLIYPGTRSRPFVDFRAKIETLDDRQKNRVVGASNYKLIQAGKAEWSDVVTQSRIRDFREIVSLKKLDVTTLQKVGIDKRTADEAFKSVHTAAHEIAMTSRERIIAALKAKGISQEEAKRAVGERLGARFGISGPSGPGRMPPPGPMPQPPIGPRPLPGTPESGKGITLGKRIKYEPPAETKRSLVATLKEAFFKIVRPLSPARILNVFGIKLKSSVRIESDE